MNSLILEIIFLGLYLSRITLGQTVQKIHIPSGRSVNLKNPEYPNQPFKYGATLQWDLEVEPEGIIKFSCPDLRMGQNQPLDRECSHVYLMVDDGHNRKKICGPSTNGFTFNSKGRKLIVKFVSTSSGSGFINCFAKSTVEPNENEIIEIRQYQKAKIIELSDENRAPYFDKVWLLQSGVGTRISVQCDIELNNDAGCSSKLMTFYDGESNKEYCGSKRLNLFTKGNSGKIRIQLDESGSGTVFCILQAVTGPNINEHDNVISEEVDSSEYGVKSGSRGTSCDCGKANKFSNNARIYFGHQTKPNEFPWMVDLLIQKSYSTRCGGSIITGRHILTAAHCVVDKFTKQIAKPENVWAVLAEHDRIKVSGNEVLIPGKRIFVHEKYFQDVSNDVAVIYIKDPIPFSNIIGRVCLEPKPLPIINRRIMIMGWGATEHGFDSPVLLRAKARVIDPTLCRGEQHDVCISAKESNVCNGDSGSPLVWVDPETNRYVQVSLVSRGTDCRNATSFSTEIAHFYNWIQDKIQRTNPSELTCHKV